MTEAFDPDDHDGWDIERDGRMADYPNLPIKAEVEQYNPDKDPVNKGLVPDPYGGENVSN